MPKQVELLLLENIDNLGIIGDVVQVKSGFARNYLLPTGKAATPTKVAIERLAERRKEVEAQLSRERAERESLVEKLNEYELTMERSANEDGVLYGGVSQHDIALALQAVGFNVDDRAVRIGDQIKRLDSYRIPIMLDKDLQTEIKLWVVSDRPTEELDAAMESEEATAELDEDEYADD